MARKNRAVGLDKPTRERLSDEAETSRAEPNPLELAVPVSDVVQILSVSLRGGSIESDQEVYAGRGGHQVRVAIDKVDHRIEVEPHTLVVTVSFSLTARRDDEAGSPSLAIRATFALAYELPREAEFEVSRLEAFATTNGVFNAWPYWREYVQSTTARMGLPPITVPVFRL